MINGARMNGNHFHLPVTNTFLMPLLWGSLWLVFPAPASAADARTDQPVQFSSSPEVTRVVRGTDGKVQYRPERLSNPDRVYCDLKCASSSRKQYELITVNDKLLNRIRTAPKDATPSRI